MPRQLDDQKRLHILNAALEVFGSDGFASTTIKDIADLAGIAPGTVYTYFQDKVDLFSSVAQMNWDGFRERVATILTSTGDPGSIAEALLDEGLGWLKKLHPLLRGMYSESLKRNLMSDNVDQFAELLIQGMAGETPESGPWKHLGVEERRYFLRLVIIGILFDAAMTSPEDLDLKIRDIRARVGMLIGREW